MPDIDIDFPDRNRALELFEHVAASRNEDGEFKAHNTGIYVTPIPRDVRNNRSTIDYKEAEQRGYFKIDFLNVGMYQGVRDEEHLKKLIDQEPVWELLEDDSFTDLLFHINGYGKILRQMKPTSVEELAMLLALIRPAKRHLLGKTWIEIGQEIWEKPENGEYYFKKSHAVAYATAIVVQMNLICENLTSPLSN
jgi:DNA polymerase III alpha subunit